MSTILPSLRIPTSKKEKKEWLSNIFMFVSNNMSIYSSRIIRASVRDKTINIDLYNNRIHIEDLTNLVNPMDLKTVDETREIQHYPVAAPIIDLLVGENIARPFEPIVQIKNNIQLADKQARLREYVDAEIKKLTYAYREDPDTLKIELQKLSRYLKYTYKDIIEKKGSALLADSKERLKLDEKFIEAFRRMWLTGEEGYEIDVVNGNTTFDVINTSTLRLYGGGRSNKMEDYDLIVIESHFSPGYLIDRYGSQLSEADIERIITYSIGDSGMYGARFDKPYGDVTHEFRPVGDILGEEISENYVDSFGGIRHLRVRFKAYRKLKKVFYQDPVTEAQQVKVLPFNYKLKFGETLKETVTIPEWQIGTLIGADIIVDTHPIPLRYNRLNSLMESHPGVVGRIYNINNKEVLPPMSRIRAFQYLYDVTMDSLVKAMSKNIGPILEMDFAKKPDKWGTMKWLNYMFKYNTKFVDSFKEVNKGPSMGQLVGNLASGRDQMQSFDFSQYISQLIQILEYLERAMGDTLGVVPQRMGAIHSKESVGGVERATSQSSHITEWYFFTHEETKIEALNILLEAEKSNLKDNPRRLHYVLDKKVLEILDITEDDLANIDLGLSVTNSREAQEYKKLLEQSAHAFMQNGGDFSFVFDIITSPSMAEKRRLIEDYESGKKAEAQEMQQAQQQAFKATQDALAAKEQADRDAEKYKVDAQNEVDLVLGQMKMMSDAGKLNVDKIRTMEELKMDMLTLQEVMGKNEDEYKLKSRELDIKEKDVNNKNKQPAKVA